MAVPLNTETSSVRQQLEEIAMELSVIQKLRPVRAAEAGNPKQALRELGFHPAWLTEQHGGCAKQDVIPQETQSA